MPQPRRTRLAAKPEGAGTSSGSHVRIAPDRRRCRTAVRPRVPDGGKVEDRHPEVLLESLQEVRVPPGHRTGLAHQQQQVRPRAELAEPGIVTVPAAGDAGEGLHGGTRITEPRKDIVPVELRPADDDGRRCRVVVVDVLVVDPPARVDPVPPLPPAVEQPSRPASSAAATAVRRLDVAFIGRSPSGSSLVRAACDRDIVDAPARTSCREDEWDCSKARRRS